jgi:hypothetical protein
VLEYFHIRLSFYFKSVVEFDSASSITEEFDYNGCDYNLPSLIDHQFCFCNNGIIMMEVLELLVLYLVYTCLIASYTCHQTEWTLVSEFQLR